MPACPACASKKLRHGYRTAPLPLRLLGVRTLLCDECNFQFRAFSPLPPHRHRPSARKADSFTPAPAVDLAALNQAGTTQPRPPINFDRAAPPVLNAAVAPPPPNLRTVVTALHSVESSPSLATAHACPQCGSHDTKRRHRRAWERVLFFLTEIRAYSCGDCSASFYARRSSQRAAAGKTRGKTRSA